MIWTYLCSQICEILGPMCWLNLHNLTKRTGVKEKYQISSNTHKVLQKWFSPHSNLFAKLKKNGKFSEAKLEHLFNCLCVFLQCLQRFLNFNFWSLPYLSIIKHICLTQVLEISLITSILTLSSIYVGLMVI